jgi:hypothetical protein
MWTKEAARLAYPRGEGEEVSTGDYTPMVSSLGEILLTVEDACSWEGDSRFLLRWLGQYGILIFGWGSCSGCDALQACTSLDDLIELRNRLAEEVVWFNSAEECANYIRDKDWKMDRCYSEPESQDFVDKALAILTGAS